MFSVSLVTNIDPLQEQWHWLQEMQSHSDIDSIHHYSSLHEHETNNPNHMRLVEVLSTFPIVTLSMKTAKVNRRHSNMNILRLHKPQPIHHMDLNSTQTQAA